MRRASLSGLLAFALVGCHDAPSDGGAFPRSQTLYVGGYQSHEPVSFNPLASAPAWPVQPYNSVNLMYEPLFVFNTLTGKMEPLLGQSFAMGEMHIDVTVQPTARFSDGRPVTAHDVKYTFDLGQQHKSLPVAPLWRFLSSIEIIGPEAKPHPRQLRFHLNPERKNPLSVLDYLQETPILPRHVFAPLFAEHGNDAAQVSKLALDAHPVSSGPYGLVSFSAERIVTERRDDYWGNQVFFGGKRAAPRYVIHPIYKSNDHYSVALQQGRLDASAAFVPRIWLKRRKGVRAWYDEVPYFPPGAMPLLFINVTEAPLDDVHLRRAMAFSIRYDDIRELAVSGYSQPLQSGLILPFGFEGKYFSEADAKQYGASRFDPARARAELEAGGYQPIFDSAGELVETRDRHGRSLRTLTVSSPAGWTDWESIVRIAVRSMRSVGIDVRERFIESSQHRPLTYAGDFDLMMFTPSPPPTPSKPWSRFDTVLSTLDFQRPGRKMFKNMGRFNDPSAPGYVRRFDELLALIPTLDSESELRRAYRELNVLFMKYQPALPVVYRPDQFYEFSEKAWTGFPTAAKPFLPPQAPGARMGTRSLWHLSPTPQAD
ncbi:MAG TPA: ABC transporter substrate-binding protein [Polyangiaceae bacterium]